MIRSSRSTRAIGKAKTESPKSFFSAADLHPMGRRTDMSGTSFPKKLHNQRPVSCRNTRPLARNGSSLSTKRLDLNPDFGENLSSMAATPRRRVVSSRKRYYSNASRIDSSGSGGDLLSLSQIKHMKKELEQTKRKTIYWGNSAETLTIYDDIKIEDTEKCDTSKNIMGNYIDNVDMNNLKPANIISSTIGVLDLLNLPLSV